MQAILNEKVKHREAFRPFAPSVCAEDADEYFECDSPLPRPADYMLMVYPVREKWRARLPAVTHVDGTGRLQTVRRETNPLYYDLIKAFGERTGIPMLVNTSFNIRGEPIVCAPADAYRCLFLGNFLIRREDNPGDIWDGEADAKD
jgi:carbamoyltransferase